MERNTAREAKRLLTNDGAAKWHEIFVQIGKIFGKYFLIETSGNEENVQGEVESHVTRIFGMEFKLQWISYDQCSS